MSSQLAKLWDYSSTVCVRRRRFLFLETNLLPGRGAPLRFYGTVFPDWCLPGKGIVTQSTGHRQVIPSYTTHKLRVRFLKWHAAGEIHITFSDSRRLEEKSKFFNLFSDCPLMTCSLCLANSVSSVWVASLRFISALWTQRKWYMPPVLLGWQRISCYENRTDALGDLPACCYQWVRPNPF